MINSERGRQVLVRIWACEASRPRSWGVARLKYVPAVATDLASQCPRGFAANSASAPKKPLCPSEAAADVVVGAAANNGAPSSLRLCESSGTAP